MLFKASKKRSLIVVATIGVALMGAVVCLAFSIVFALFFNYDERVNGPMADKIQHDLESEFQSVPPLPRALTTQHGSMHKTQQGIVSAAYKTALNYEGIIAHYDNELATRGWRFVNETNVIYGGENYGGRERLYCKGRYAASLQYAGGQENEFGWTYSFALMWGPSDGCK
jgi:hypothetical protein